MQIIELELAKLSVTTNDGLAIQSIMSRLRQQFQSSNINILLGAGFSVDVAGLLGDYERNISEAQAKIDNKHD